MIKEDWILEQNPDKLPEWCQKAQEKVRRMPTLAREVRQRCMNDLFYYANLMNKGYMYGDIHKEFYSWMQDYILFDEAKAEEENISSNKLIMLPRAHLKSHMVATWVSWMTLRHPEITILYISATAELAIKQLYAAKNIIGGTTFQRYFPEYIEPQEGKREKWTTEKIIIDHPLRKLEGIRDETIATAGLTTNTTGWHADIVVADDLVVPENAYTEDGRETVVKKTSQFTSIRNAGGFTMACGTRYHPNDIYATWKEQVFTTYDDEGDIEGSHNVWDIKEYAVEDDGYFIWPRMTRPDGKAFGFNLNTLARIKAEYEDGVQFYAQYYNNPNDPSSDRISKDKFQYANPRLLRKEGSRWMYNGKRLNIYAAVDFAYSLTQKADWSAIVVVGVDSDKNYYVLDIDRFKTKKNIVYFEHIAELHARWNFRKLLAEVTAAQDTIVEAIKDYVKERGSSLSIETHRPNRQEGKKEERIAAALEHRYDNMQVWHFEGGYTKVLEEELIQARPKHDDIKDALACAVTIAVPPARSMSSKINDFMGGPARRNRFGGIR